MYNASRRFGFLLAMDGGKDVRFLSKCVEGGASVTVGSRVHFQDFVSGDRRNAHAVRVFSGTTAGVGVVEFFDREKGFGRLIPFDGSGVAVYFNERVVDASKGGARALRKGTVVQFKEPGRRGGGKRHASRVRVKPS